MLWKIVEMVLMTGLVAAPIAVITWHVTRPKPKTAHTHTSRCASCAGAGQSRE